MMTKGCENFQCDYQDKWIYNNGFQERTNWSQILIFYTLLRCLIDVLRASSVMMFEGAVVVTIKQMGGDYGLQKLFGTFGAIIWGPISGQILDMASSDSGKENYEPIFYLFFVMRFISALLILKLNLSFKKPAKKVFKVRTNKPCDEVLCQKLSKVVKSCQKLSKVVKSCQKLSKAVLS